MQQMSVTPDMMQQQYNQEMYAQQWPNQFAAAGLPCLPIPCPSFKRLPRSAVSRPVHTGKHMN